MAPPVRKVPSMFVSILKFRALDKAWQEHCKHNRAKDPAARVQALRASLPAHLQDPKRKGAQLTPNATQQAATTAQNRGPDAVVPQTIH
jgi:hypothetical protein